MRTII